MEDKMLIERCKRGDAAALRRIYEKYRDGLLVLATAMTGDAAAAEDVLHDVFLNFARQMDGFRLTGGLRSYLSVCVANRARNWRRGVRRGPVVLPEEDVAASGALQEPSRAAIANEEMTLLAQAMGQIPKEQREAVALHLGAGLRFREIARRLGVSTNTAKSRYRYGIEKLRSILNGRIER